MSFYSIDPAINNYKNLHDHQNNPPEMGVARLFKKDRSKNKLFNERGKGTQDGSPMVPQQVLDTLEATLILQVPCPGDKGARVYDLCLRATTDYCEELGYSCMIKRVSITLTKVISARSETRPLCIPSTRLYFFKCA